MGKSDIKKKVVNLADFYKRNSIALIPVKAPKGLRVGVDELLLKAIRSEIKGGLVALKEAGEHTYTGVYEIVKMGPRPLELYGDLVGTHCTHKAASGSTLGEENIMEAEYILCQSHELGLLWDPEELRESLE